MSYNQPPPPPGGGYGAPQPAYGGGGQAEHPKGTTILILGILSIVCCGVFTGIPALIMGNSAQAEIASGQYAPTSTVKIGRILGIISIVWTVIVVIAYIGLFAAS